MPLGIFSHISGRVEKTCRRLIVFGVVFAFTPIALYGIVSLIVCLVPGRSRARREDCM